MFDWFTIGAQLLNFLVLIWLLKRFLYQPILEALDAREHRISAELADADNKKQQAQAEQAEFLQKNQAFEQQRAQLFAQMNEEAKVHRQSLLDEVRAEADNLRLKQQQALQDEQKNLMTVISQRTQTEVLAIARQTLQNLAGVSLESHIVSVFIEKLQNINDSEKQKINTSAMPLEIRTAFELSPNQKTDISQAVEKAFGLKSELQFSIAAHLISGIELSSDGYKFSWSVADYLAGLEKNFDIL